MVPCEVTGSARASDCFSAARAAGGNLAKAREIFYRQLPLLQFIVQGGLPTTIKGGLKLLGLEAGVPREPLSPMSTEATEHLKGILDKIGSPREN